MGVHLTHYIHRVVCLPVAGTPGDVDTGHIALCDAMDLRCARSWERDRKWCHQVRHSDNGSRDVLYFKAQWEKTWWDCEYVSQLKMPAHPHCNGVQHVTCLLCVGSAGVVAASKLTAGPHHHTVPGAYTWGQRGRTQGLYHCSGWAQTCQPPWFHTPLPHGQETTWSPGFRWTPAIWTHPPGSKGLQTKSEGQFLFISLTCQHPTKHRWISMHTLLA